MIIFLELKSIVDCFNEDKEKFKSNFNKLIESYFIEDENFKENLFKTISFINEIKKYFFEHAKLCLSFVFDKVFEFDIIQVLEINGSKKIICTEIENNSELLICENNNFSSKKNIEKIKRRIYFLKNYFFEYDKYFVFHSKLPDGSINTKINNISFEEIKEKEFETMILEKYTDEIEILRDLKSQKFIFPYFFKEEIFTDPEILNSIYRNIIENNLIYINSLPGTGKTLIAFEILKLIKNDKKKNIYYFNPSINFTRYVEDFFKSKDISLKDKYNIFFGGTTESFKKLIKNEKKIDFIIIDEAQRSDRKLIELILNKNIKLILFFDEKQRINPEKDSFNISKYIESLKKEEKFNIKEHKIKKNYFRIDKKDLNFIDDLIYKDNLKSSTEKKSINFFLVEDYEEFFKAFLKENRSRKCIATIQGFYKLPKNCSGFKLTENKQENRYLFLENKINEKFVLTAYELMSRELDIIYIYLPEKFKIFVLNEKLKWEYIPTHDIEFYKNQLWILFTRAREKVVIFSDNDDTKKYLSEKIKP